MFNDRKTYLLKTLTPTHAGSGEALSYIDMPIQREKHTNFPKFEGSSLKGALKHSIYNRLKSDNEELPKRFHEVFGNDDSDQMSEIVITDAKLLFFPVRSSNDIFMLITCPFVIERFYADNMLGEDIRVNVESNNILLHSYPERLKLETLSLEEYKFTCEFGDLSFIKKIAPDSELNKVGIISNEMFEAMVSLYTEVITRNRIDYITGTAKDTGLFTEEYLPAESILYFNILQSAPFSTKTNSDSALKFAELNFPDVFQIGANETIGKGFVKLSELKGGDQ